MEAKAKERNYGVDCLRMVSMLMVVVLHVLGQGGILSSTGGLTVKGETAWFLEIASYCAVNCYALISGYVAYRSNRKWRTFVSLWLQVVFYSVLINIADIVFVTVTTGNFPVQGARDVVKTLGYMFLPVFNNQYWYITAYTGLFLCMPLLNIVIKHAPRTVLKTAFLSLMFVAYFGERLFSTSTFGFGYGYSFLWLALLYVMGGYMAKYNSLHRLSVKKSFLYYALCVLFTFLTRIVLEIAVYWYKGEVVKNSWESLMLSYTTPTIILAAAFLLNAFSRMKVGTRARKAIAFFSPLSLGVYLIHTHPIVYTKLGGAFVPYTHYPVFLMVACVVLTAACIYLLCTVIEILRVYLFRLCGVKKLSVCAENLIERLAKKFSLFLGILPDEVEEKE